MYSLEINRNKNLIHILACGIGEQWLCSVKTREYLHNYCHGCKFQALPLPWQNTNVAEMNEVNRC